jgi:hypothetical protein
LRKVLGETFVFERPTLEKIWTLSKEINRIKKVDLTNKKDRDPVKIMFFGLRAQYAVNTMLGTPFDWEVHPGNDGGTDGVFLGKTYQVKYSKYMPPKVYLAFSMEQPLTAEMAILVVPLVDEKVNMHVQVLGYIDAPDFFLHAKQVNWGSYVGENCVHHTLLKPFGDLLAQIPPPETLLSVWEKSEHYKFINSMSTPEFYQWQIDKQKKELMPNGPD